MKFIKRLRDGRDPVILEFARLMGYTIDQFGIARFEQRAQLEPAWREFLKQRHAECIVEIPSSVYVDTYGDSDNQWSILVWSETSMYQIDLYEMREVKDE